MISDRVWFALAEWMTPDAENSRRWELKNRLLRQTGLMIGEQTAVSRGFICYNPSRATIERFAAIGQNVHLFNFGTLRVGAFATVAQDVSIVNGWHQTKNLEPDSGPTVIGRGSWIGLGARVVGSVTLGDLCIVGAGALVIRDVPERAIVAGVPAQVIGYRDVSEWQWHFRQIYFHSETFDVASPTHPRESA